MTLTVGSLFSGIGGLDLGLERAGMKVVWQSEIDPYACKVLKKHWPEVPNHGDIKQIDWRAVEPVDVICGGYPCQPFSHAGKRQGTEDPRHLWPWVRTAISELRPRYAILENVRGHLTMGGLQVVGELAEIGYDAEWRVVSAAGLGAPHRRERIIIVAYPNDTRSGTSERRIDTDGSKEIKEWENVAQFGVSGCSKAVANTDSERWKRRVWAQEVVTKNGGFDLQSTSCKWGDEWIAEPNVGRVANGISKRMDKLRGLGNAVVPQVAEYIGRLITTSLDA
jgi:DNA (cytosine-5)-methyltransferase 1